MRWFARDATWLTADRVIAATRIMLVMWLGLTASLPWTAPWMQVARDFAAFWTAAKLAMAGHAADAYGSPAREALAALFGPGTYAPFFYPPTALLIWAPFALLPFAVAAALWVGGTAVGYVVAIRAVLRTRSLVVALAFPGVLIAALYGQNSLFSAALFGGAAATLDRYPVLAGSMIGCLAYKPQLAVLAPFALASAGRWRAFFAAMLTAMSLTGLSAIIFGMKAWAAFIAAVPGAKAWNANGVAGFEKFVSIYTAVRLRGGSESFASIAQGTSVAIAIIALIGLTRRRPGGAAEIAMLVVATGFCVPYLGQYDIVIFAVPGAWIASEAIRTNWLPYERATLALLYLAPLAITAGMANGVPLAPLALMMLALLVLRRALRRNHASS
jgi:hypothetical protein